MVSHTEATDVLTAYRPLSVAKVSDQLLQRTVLGCISSQINGSALYHLPPATQRIDSVFALRVRSTAAQFSIRRHL